MWTRDFPVALFLNPLEKLLDKVQEGLCPFIDRLEKGS